MRIYRFAISLICAVLLATAANVPAAHAADASVGVKVSFEFREISEPWGDKAKQETVQKNCIEQLNGLLGEFFPYWRFAPTSKDHTARLRFRIIQGLQGKILIRVEAYLKTLRLEKWDTPWLQQTDIAEGVLANPDTVPEVLRGAVDAGVLSLHDREIESWLRSQAPVAVGGYWTTQSATPQAVLALPYTRFELVGASVFEVLGKASSDRTEKLEVVGLSYKAPFPSAGGPNAFDALVVNPLSRLVRGRRHKINEAGLPSVRDLELGQIYLKEMRSTSDPDVLIAPEDRG